MAGTTYAVLVAVEHYQQEGMSDVEYAAADATAMREVLIKELLVPKENISLWIDQDATQARLQNDLRYDVEQLGPDDRFIFFYAGHGFYIGGSNHVTTWDSHPANLTATTTSLDEVLLSPLRKGNCRQSLVFIDACAALLSDASPLSRDLLAAMDQREFAEFVRSQDYAAAFFSCAPAERSYSSPNLLHGIWTYHLLSALRGKAKEAIQKDRWITGESLRDYLAYVVPKYIREKTNIKGKQRPYAAIHTTGAFEIFKVPEPTALAAALPRITLRFADAYFRGYDTQPFKQLAGFDRKRGHSVPTGLSDSAEAWAGRLLHDEMTSELESIRAQAKQVLNLKRRDIRMDIDEGNGGTIDTEWFRFSIVAGQNPDDPSEAFVEREIVLRVTAEELPSTFDDIFPCTVDEVIIPFSLPSKSYDDLADALEALAEKSGAAFDEIQSERTLTVRLPKPGALIVFDMNRNRMSISGSDCSECSTLIQLIRTTPVTLMIGTAPALIGQAKS